jgi:hypothetical protein
MPVSAADTGYLTGVLDMAKSLFLGQIANGEQLKCQHRQLVVSLKSH